MDVLEVFMKLVNVYIHFPDIVKFWLQAFVLSTNYRLISFQNQRRHIDAYNAICFVTYFYCVAYLSLYCRVSYRNWNVGAHMKPRQHLFYSFQVNDNLFPPTIKKTGQAITMKRWKY